MSSKRSWKLCSIQHEVAGVVLHVVYQIMLSEKTSNEVELLHKMFSLVFAPNKDLNYVTHYSYRMTVHLFIFCLSRCCRKEPYTLTHTEEEENAADGKTLNRRSSAQAWLETNSGPDGLCVIDCSIITAYVKPCVHNGTVGIFKCKIFTKK